MDAEIDYSNGFEMDKTMRLITVLFFVGIINSYSLLAQTCLEDSMVNRALRLSERALYDARFEEAKEIVNPSYFKKFKDYSIEHEILLSIQNMRIDGIAHNVSNKKTNHQVNLQTLLQYLADTNKIEKPEVLGQLFFALSQAYHSNEIKDTAALYHEKSLSIFHSLRNFEKMAEIRAYAISLKHTMLQHQGNKEQVLELIPAYEKEIEFSKLYSKYVLAYNTRHLAQIYRSQTCDYEKALHLFKWSLHLRLEIGFKPYLPASYASLGDVYMKMGEDKLAIEMYAEASRLAEEIGFIRYQVYPNLQIGDIYRNKQDREKASAWYSKALKRASENNYAMGIDQSMERMAKINLTKATNYTDSIAK